MTSINDLYFSETDLFSKSSAQIIVRAAKKMQKIITVMAINMYNTVAVSIPIAAIRERFFKMQERSSPDTVAESDTLKKQFHKFLLLLGPRYNVQSQCIEMLEDSLPFAEQNLTLIRDNLMAAIEEAKSGTDYFEDVPVDSLATKPLVIVEKYPFEQAMLTKGTA